MEMTVHITDFTKEKTVPPCFGKIHKHYPAPCYLSQDHPKLMECQDAKECVKWVLGNNLEEWR